MKKLIFDDSTKELVKEALKFKDKDFDVVLDNRGKKLKDLIVNELIKLLS